MNDELMLDRQKEAAALKQLERRNAAAARRRNRLRAEALRSSLEKQPWRGVDWAVSTMRPGCQDFLEVPSLQPNGDRKPYRTPTYACVGTLKDRTSNAKD